MDPRRRAACSDASLVNARDPELYVDSCLERVCEQIGIPDEGRRSAPYLTSEIAVDVDWEDDAVAPHTVRLGMLGQRAAHVVASYWSDSGAVPVVVGPPAPVTRAARTQPRADRGVHPAVVCCAIVSILAFAVSFVTSPYKAPVSSRAGRVLSGLVATR